MAITSTNIHRLLIDGLTIHVLEKPVNGLAIVFLHGRCLSVSMWENQFASQQLASYRLLAIDLPGHGNSSHSPIPLHHYSLSGQIDIIRRVLEQLQVANFVLVGHSLGGHLALSSIPHLTDCLGVVAMTIPIVKPLPFLDMYHHAAVLGEVYRENSNPAVVEHYSRLSLHPNATVLPAQLTDDFYRTDPAVHRAINHMVEAGLYADETDIIRQSPIPVAIVIGEADQIMNIAYLQTLDLPLWRNSPHLIPQAGHFLPWEQAEVVNKVLREFVGELSTRE